MLNSVGKFVVGPSHTLPTPPPSPTGEDSQDAWDMAIPAKPSNVWWSNDFFEIKPSSTGGLGAFAVKDLEYGDLILMERPIIATTTTIWDLYPTFHKLDSESQELFLGLHAFSANKNAHIVDKIRRANS